MPSIVYQPFSASESVIPAMCLLGSFQYKYGDCAMSRIYVSNDFNSQVMLLCFLVLFFQPVCPTYSARELTGSASTNE